MFFNSDRYDNPTPLSERLVAVEIIIYCKYKMLFAIDQLKIEIVYFTLQVSCVYCWGFVDRF